MTEKRLWVENRRSRRAIIAKSMRVRPSGPEDAIFEDAPISVNVSRGGLYFTTRRRSYYAGMPLVLTFPFQGPGDPRNSDYLGRVARIERLANGRFGIGVQFLIDLTKGTAANSSTPQVA